MSGGNLEYERKSNFELKKRTVTGTVTVRTGRGADTNIIDVVIDVVDPAADFTITIPDGTYEGQQLLITFSSDASSKTVTTAADTGSGGDSTMGTAGMYMFLLWVNSTTGWVAVSESVTS